MPEKQCGGGKIHRRARASGITSTFRKTASEAYVANSGSKTNVSVIDLEKRMVIGNVRVGASPGMARVSPDGATVVVSNRGDNTVSLIDVEICCTCRRRYPSASSRKTSRILPDSSKAFVTCSGSSQVASISLPD